MIAWLNDDSRLFLERGYLLPGVTPEARMRQISESAEKILKIKGFADKFVNYLHRGWLSLACPVWTNLVTGKDLSISFNGSYVPDSMDGILAKLSEVGMMTKYGAGTSAYVG